MKHSIVLWLLFPCVVFAQNIQVEHYGSNPAVELSELWKIQFSGLSGSSNDIWMKAEVRRQSQLVYQASTEPLALSEGTQLIDQFKIQIRSRHFHESAWEDYVIATGRLPEGIYTGCVTVYKGQSELKTLCLEIRSENYSPPMLVYPYHGQELTSTTPVLSWLAPVPNAVQGITYQLRLVEQFEGQTAQEALLRNPARVNQGDIVGTSIPYPPDALSLEIDHNYAWQVEAYVGSTKIGITQVWAFRVVELNEHQKGLIRNQDYIELKAEMNPNPVSAIKRLNIKVVEQGSLSKYSIQVYDQHGSELNARLGSLKNRSGDNYHKIDLSRVRGIRHDTMYVVVLTDEETGQRYRMNVQYLDPDKL